MFVYNRVHCCHRSQLPSTISVQLAIGFRSHSTAIGFPHRWLAGDLPSACGWLVITFKWLVDGLPVATAPYLVALRIECGWSFIWFMMKPLAIRLYGPHGMTATISSAGLVCLGRHRECRLHRGNASKENVGRGIEGSGNVGIENASRTALSESVSEYCRSCWSRRQRDKRLSSIISVQRFNLPVIYILWCSAVKCIVWQPSGQIARRFLVPVTFGESSTASVSGFPV